jgi:phosphoglucomutase
MLSEGVLSQVKYWSESSVFDSETRSEVKKMLTGLEYDELKQRFLCDLEFGTGGIRALTGVGSNRLNVYTIKKITCAYALHLQKKFPQTLLSVAVSYDTRVHSKTFAKACAEVFAGYGIRVYLTKDSRPTPVLSFLLREYKCCGGVCITASHNPCDYNGYKVFSSFGGQVVPPEDEEIIAEYTKINSFSEINYVEFKKAVDLRLICLLGEKLDQKFLNNIVTHRVFSFSKPQTKIVYTPLHGVGGSCVPAALKLFGFDNVEVLTEQDDGNGLFPTLASPNPEDPECFSLAKILAKKVGANILLANDPDADRFSLCVKDKNNWRYINGQELAGLLAEFILSKDNSKSGVIIKTLVTNDLLLDIAQNYQVDCIETLIGFKWIGDYLSQELDNKGSKKVFLGAFEESLGFLLGSHARDKDGVLGAALACEMISQVLKDHGSIDQALDSLYLKYNYYCQRLHTISLKSGGGVEAEVALNKIRSQKTFATAQLIEVIDYLNKDINKPNYYKVGKNNMLTLLFANGLKVTLRPSGTEPKLKLYASLKMATKGFERSDLLIVKEESEKIIKNIITELSDFIGIN